MILKTKHILLSIKLKTDEEANTKGGTVKSIQNIEICSSVGVEPIMPFKEERELINRYNGQ